MDPTSSRGSQNHDHLQHQNVKRRSRDETPELRGKPIEPLEESEGADVASEVLKKVQKTPPKKADLEKKQITIKSGTDEDVAGGVDQVVKGRLLGIQKPNVNEQAEIDVVGNAEQESDDLLDFLLDTDSEEAVSDGGEVQDRVSAADEQSLEMMRSGVDRAEVQEKPDVVGDTDKESDDLLDFLLDTGSDEVVSDGGEVQDQVSAADGQSLEKMRSGVERAEIQEQPDVVGNAEQESDDILDFLLDTDAEEVVSDGGGEVQDQLPSVDGEIPEKVDLPSVANNKASSDVRLSGLVQERTFQKSEINSIIKSFFHQNCLDNYKAVSFEQDQIKETAIKSAYLKSSSALIVSDARWGKVYLIPANHSEHEKARLKEYASMEGYAFTEFDNTDYEGCIKQILNIRALSNKELFNKCSELVLNGNVVEKNSLLYVQNFKPESALLTPGEDGKMIVSLKKNFEPEKKQLFKDYAIENGYDFNEVDDDLWEQYIDLIKHQLANRKKENEKTNKSSFTKIEYAEMNNQSAERKKQVNIEENSKTFIQASGLKTRPMEDKEETKSREQRVREEIKKEMEESFTKDNINLKKNLKNKKNKKIDDRYDLEKRKKQIEDLGKLDD